MKSAIMEQRWYTLVVEADHNDGDYTVELSKVSADTLKILMPIFGKIAANDGEWNKSLYEEDDFIYFEQFLPKPDYGNGIIHTIVDIHYYPERYKTQLFKRY